MLNLTDTILGKEKTLSPIKDPFNKNSLEGVSIRALKLFSGNWHFYGNVEFINGSTKGEQKIHGSSLNEVIQQTEVFLKTLN